jgi:2,3-diketo-5-methylthio-1-phosphopentane phosphatase
MKDKSFKIFIDFDGTVTVQDVGEAIFSKYGNYDEIYSIIDDLLNDRISSKECWIKLCNSVGTIDINSLNEFIDTLEVERGFSEFVDFCSANDFELFILSDGFDYYINRILKRESLDHIKVYSNKLVITNDNKLKPSFPHYNERCFSSANCKWNHIINLSGDDDFTVFIGDGNSDKETIQYCDFIFAKDDLLKFCEKERITYFPFKNFNDVIKKLNQLILIKRLKKRHRAELKRRETYTIE